MRIDALVTISRGTPGEYVRQCVRTVSQAAMRSPFEVRVLLVPGFRGHIGKAMSQCLEHCSGDYVTWIDDDDFVAPEAFSCLAKHLPARPTAIFAREAHLYANARLVPQDDRHHLSLYRRDLVDTVPLATYAAVPNIALIRAAEREGNVIDEMSWIYIRRIRRSAASKLRSQMAAHERALL